MAQPRSNTEIYDRVHALVTKVNSLEDELGVVLKAITRSQDTHANTIRNELNHITNLINQIHGSLFVPQPEYLTGNRVADHYPRWRALMRVRIDNLPPKAPKEFKITYIAFHTEGDPYNVIRQGWDTQTRRYTWNSTQEMFQALDRYYGVSH